MTRQALSPAILTIATILAAAPWNGPARAGSMLPSDPPSPRVVEAGTRFGLRLHAELVKRAGRPNVFISPPSVALALSMTANGAAGSTREAMLRALDLSGVDLDEVNRANAALLKSLQDADPNVRLSIANSLWSRKGLVFKDSFLEVNRATYAAEARALDFGDPGSAGVINGWVRDRTEGKIPAILDQIRPEDILFLINAIYFKGTWTDAFKKELTREGPFTLGDGSKVSHPMMSRSGSYAYLKTDMFQAVALPYSGRRFSMYFFLPAEGSDLKAFERSLTADAWAAWMGSFRRIEGAVTIPRFTIRYEATLNDALSALGMAEAFDARKADFTGMIEAREVFISQVRHKTFVEVNEEGTEAAAATSVGVSVTSLLPSPFRMVIDRPFFCAIRDDQTGTVLFMGSIGDPRE